MTSDNGMDSSPSWQELKDERDVMEKRARAYEAGSAKLQSERDALRRTVARQDGRIRELEAEVRRLRSTEQIKAEGVREYLEDFSAKAQETLRKYL